jgi:hypothetical protein
MDFYDFLTIPAFFEPTDSTEEAQKKLQDMALRAEATRDYIHGDLSYDQFEQALDYTGIDPIDCYNHWIEGETLGTRTNYIYM